MLDSIEPAAYMICLFVVMLAMFLISMFQSAFRGYCEGEHDNRMPAGKNASWIDIFFQGKERRILYAGRICFATLLLIWGICYLQILRQGEKFADPISWLIVIGSIVPLFGLTVLLPEAIGNRYKKGCYRILSYVLIVLYGAAYLFVVILEGILRLILSKNIMNYMQSGEDVTEDGIINMVKEGHEQGILEDNEAKMIHNIFEMSETTAEEIMTPRNNILAIEKNMLLSEAVLFVLQNSNSRYPVYDEHLDQIIGILHLKDIMRYQAKEGYADKPVYKCRDILRDVKFVSNTQKIDAIFAEMQTAKTQIAIVVDEYAQTLGLVTMEDILEEIVGNIMDEYDKEEFHVIQQTNNVYIISALTSLNELEDIFPIHFEECEFDTLNGYMISRMQHIPEEDEKFEMYVGRYLFRIKSVKNKMIHEVEVIKPLQEEGE